MTTHMPASDSRAENLRVAALHQLQLLDTDPAESFDRVTRLAAKVLGTPIALVSLVDVSRQWFKSRVGLECAETPRSVSFCTHAIQSSQALIVPDARLDQRFASNPLVTDAPHIRAYLGVPLLTRDGHAIGTFCVLDRQVRHFTADEVATLRTFALIVQESIRGLELEVHTRAVLEQSLHNEELFRHTFEQSSVGIIHTALNGQLMRINRRACEMLGYAEDELRSVSYVDLTHPDDVVPNTAQFQQLLAGEIRSFEVDKRFRRKNGEYLWVHLSAAIKRSATGALQHTITVIEDISARKRVEQELVDARDALTREVSAQTRKLQETNDALRKQIKQTFDSTLAVCRAEHRMRAIANNVPALIGYWNSDLCCEFANRAYKDWFGYEPEAIVGMQMQAFLGQELFDELASRVHMALTGQAQQFEAPHARADGSSIITDTRYLPDVNAQGEVLGFYVLVTDVTALRGAQQALETINRQLADDSVTDFLTGLANRRKFSAASEAAATRLRGNRESYGLILLDLDNFKRINDQFGHDAGDDVLRAVGRVLREQVRDSRDLPARLGGEEFAVLCFGAPEAAMRQLAERIREQIAKESIATAGGPIGITASVGVALGCEADAGWRSIYARADAALYEAKEAGKNRVAYRRSEAAGSSDSARTIRLVTAS